MGELTRSTTKPMLKIKGRPILEHKIKLLPRVITEIVFVIGYCGDDILRYFGRNFCERKITYIFQKNINGTGGALHLAKGFLQDKFLVMMGDDLYCRKDLTRMVRHDLAILGCEVSDPSRFGVIKFDKQGYMRDVIEKPKALKNCLANTGVYVINKHFFDYDLVSIGNGEFGLPQTMAKMAREHKIKVEKAAAWHPIGNPEDLRLAQKVLADFS